MADGIQDLSQLRSVINTRLDQLSRGEIVVTRTKGAREDCTQEFVADLKNILAFVKIHSRTPGSAHVDEQSALGGPSYEKVRE